MEIISDSASFQTIWLPASGLAIWSRSKKDRLPNFTDLIEIESLKNYSIPLFFIKLLSKGYQIRSKAKGQSMSPLILKDDFLTVMPTTYSEIQVGDIAVFGTGREGEDTLTAHRVMQKVWWKSPPLFSLFVRTRAVG